MTSQAEISIVVPLYNASVHLKTGLNSIKKQTFTNWEIIAVNDGSTDDTKEIFNAITKDWQQSVKLIDQVNAGGFAARNTGLDFVNTKYVALFDIDDRWYPQHLQELYDVLEKNSEVDWVYAANKIIDLTDNEKVLAESNFYHNGVAKEFLSLNCKKVDNLNIIDDEKAAAYQFRYGLQLGQQFSLFRKAVFQDYRFRASYRNEGADQVSVIRALKAGFKLAYLDTIHGEYAVHNNNASAGCKGAAPEKYIRLRKALIRGFKELDSEIELTPDEIKAMHFRIADDYFWQLGYNLHWQEGKREEAFIYLKKGLCYQPFNFLMWKTYFLCQLKRMFLK